MRHHFIIMSWTYEMAQKVCDSFSFLQSEAQVMDKLLSVFRRMIASVTASDMEIGLVNPQTRLSRAVSSANIEMR